MCWLRDVVGEGDIHHRNVLYIYFYIYISVCVCVLGSTAAAQLLRRSRKWKLCQTKLKLFVSLSLLVLAGSACTEFKTCLCWDVEGVFLEGSVGWDMSYPGCAELLCAARGAGSHRVSPDLPLPCPCTISLSALAACRDHSPTPESGYSGFPSPARGRSCVEKHWFLLLPNVGSQQWSLQHMPKLRVQWCWYWTSVCILLGCDLQKGTLGKLIILSAGMALAAGRGWFYLFLLLFPPRIPSSWTEVLRAMYWPVEKNNSLLLPGLGVRAAGVADAMSHHPGVSMGGLAGLVLCLGHLCSSVHSELCSQQRNRTAPGREKHGPCQPKLFVLHGKQC